MPTSPPSSSILQRHRWLAPLLLVTLVVAAYWGAHRRVFLWDDTYVVETNVLIRNPANLPLLLTDAYFEPAELGHYTRAGEQRYRPVATASHFLDYALFGDWAGGYHLVNLLLHCASVLALWRVLARIGLGGMAALSGAALYGVHPGYSEAVLLASYREDPMAGLCLLLALLAHLRSRTILATLFLVIGAFAKESAVVFAPLAVLADVLITDRNLPPVECARQRWRPWALYGAATAWIIWVVQVARVDGSLSPTAYPGGSLGAGLATSARVLLHYLKLVVAPVALQNDYTFPVSANLFDPAALGAAGLVAGLLAAAWRWLPAGAPRFLTLWFFVAVVPIIGLVPIPNYCAERYLYIPFMGACGFLGWGAARLGRPALGVAAIALIAGTLGTRARAVRYESDLAFFEGMVADNPRSYKGQSGLGLALLDAGRPDEAVSALESSLSLEPGQPSIHHNLAVIYLQKGHRPQALEHLEFALSLHPGFIEARYQRAVILREDGQMAEAEAEFRQALSVNPNFIPARFQLAYILETTGDLQTAQKIYEEIIRTDPRYAKAWKNLGVLHAYKLNQPVAATRYLRRYLELVPQDPQRDLIEQLIREYGAEAVN